MPKYNIFERRSTKFSYLAVIGVIFFVLVTGIFVTYKTYRDNLQPKSHVMNSVVITVPKGFTASEIAKLLQDKGVIRAAWAFEWYVRKHDARDKLQAGTYALKPSQSVQDIVDILSNGNIATDLVTILPGKRLDEVRDKLINDGFDAAQIDAALNPAVYADHPALVDKPAEASLEGYLYPESFQRTSETTPESVVRQSLDQMQRYLTAELRAAIVAQGLSVHQGVILASIVEREVSRGEDRPKVAQVFLRRLRESIALESDATTSYGAVLAGAEPRSGFPSPYNTYQNPGLTPGPISNVTQSSLDAVAHPAATDFLYFVSGDDGTTHFSHTIDEHRAKVRQYCSRCAH